MKKFIFSIILSVLIIPSANAYVDSNHTTSEQFLMNTGFSKEVARLIKYQKKDVYAPIDENIDKRSLYEKMYNYINPLSGSNREFPAHNINYESSHWQDL